MAMTRRPKLKFKLRWRHSTKNGGSKTYNDAELVWMDSRMRERLHRVVGNRGELGLPNQLDRPGDPGRSSSWDGAAEPKTGDRKCRNPRRLFRQEGAALNNAMKQACRDAKFVWMDLRMRERLHRIAGTETSNWTTSQTSCPSRCIETSRMMARDRRFSQVLPSQRNAPLSQEAIRRCLSSHSTCGKTIG